MAPSLERWERLERLYHDALERTPADRLAFLDETCGEDEALRRELSALLAWDDKAQAFLQEPIGAIDGGRMDATPSAPPLLEAGHPIGEFRIVRLLGRGGMGDVYEAEDVTLHRRVAVKLLTSAGSHRVSHSRVLREARAASALNHPGIVTIHAVGQDVGGHDFIVMELVEGETLRERLARGALDAVTSLDLARQIADALAAAHAHGVVHRDLKPANILVKPDGRVKLVDFGLARPEPREVTSDGTADSLTQPGLLFGTPSYMSPEQVQGAPVDTRSDIFAFGVVLHEMITGRRPFDRGSPLATLVAIARDEAPAIGPIAETVPSNVADLVARCLEKTPADRPQSAREIIAALDGLPRSPKRLSTLVSRERLPRTSRRTLIGVVAVAAAIGVPMTMRSPATVPPERARTITPITDFTDSAVAPAISPDGRMIAFLRSDNWFMFPDQIWVKLLPDGEPAQLTNTSQTKGFLAFSPDAARVAFTAGPGWDSFTVSSLGGEPRLLLPNAAGLSWLGDGRILFSEIKTGMHMGIVTATESRSERREVYYPEHERAMAHQAVASPDRAWALVVEMDHAPNWQPCRLVSLDGGSGRQVGPRGACIGAGWSPDGRWMYFSAAGGGDGVQLWRQRFPTGEPEQLTFGPNEAWGVAVFPDGGSLATSLGSAQSAVWIHDATGERAITSAGYPPSSGFASPPSFSSDGRYLYYLLRRATSAPSSELWRIDLMTRTTEAVVTAPSIIEYDLSPDDTEVVFSARATSGPPHVWIAPVDRHAAPTQISSGDDASPHFAADGDIVFRMSDGTVNYLARMGRDGSNRRKAAPSRIATIHTASPGGQWVAALAPPPDGGAGYPMMAIPTAGGPPRIICPHYCHVRWSPDGRFLYVQIERPSRTGAGESVAIPLTSDEWPPAFPAGGIRSTDDALAIPGARRVAHGLLIPSVDPATFAFVKTTMHRNLFRIPVRRD